MQTEDYEYLYALEDTFWWFEGMREITAMLLDPICPPGRNRLILDAGCGTGGNLDWLQRYAGNQQVRGIDLSLEGLQFCSTRQHKLLAQASVTALPFGDNGFDLVTSFDVLAQLPGEGDDNHALREMYRLLRPGGIIFVRVAAYQWLRSGHDQALGTHQRYRLPTLRQRVEHAGFHILRTTYANSFLLPVVMARRLIMKRLGLADPGSDVKPLASGLRWLNTAMKSVLLAEARWLRRHSHRLPAGLSAICIAEKLDNG
jgi:SAM-dependent methyltransferase